ncbi:MAG TPA: CoA transferase [Terriglobales bacterium]|nr:CoA transferase [Terriglobales bacterium]
MVSGAGPLAGIRVLDLGSYIAGPYGSALLADLGADVLKIESPDGDQLRQYPSTLPRQAASESRAFLGVNRGKRGLVLDLKRPQAQQVLRRLARQADVLIHSLRPSVPARLGIGYEQLKPENPRLIYCALSGYGERGPLRDKPGYDQVLQGFTGICTFQGAQRGNPEIVLGSVVDFYAAALIAYGVAAALFHRQRSGAGEYVRVSLLQAALAMQAQRFIWAEGEEPGVERDMRSGGVTGIYPAREGHIYVSANTPHFWQALCAALELPELASDARYDTIRKRAGRAAEILPKVRAAFLSRTALEWEARLGERVPCSAIRPIEAMFDHPQVAGNGWVREYEHPVAGRYRGLASPLEFSASPPEPARAAPALGEHTREILREGGFSDDEIEQLFAADCVR